VRVSCRPGDNEASTGDAPGSSATTSSVDNWTSRSAPDRRNSIRSPEEDTGRSTPVSLSLQRSVAVLLGPLSSLSARRRSTHTHHHGVVVVVPATARAHRLPRPTLPRGVISGRSLAPLLGAVRPMDSVSWRGHRRRCYVTRRRTLLTLLHRSRRSDGCVAASSLRTSGRRARDFASTRKLQFVIRLRLTDSSV